MSGHRIGTDRDEIGMLVGCPNGCFADELLNS